jgi:predicted metalloendopeptidase
VKMRARTSLQKWRNPYWRAEKAAVFSQLTRELFEQFDGLKIAYQDADATLDQFLLEHAKGEIGGREYACSPNIGQDKIMVRATVMAKRIVQ